MISINNIIHVVMLDDNELELTDANNDVSVHHGELIEITLDESHSFTVTFKTS